MASFTLVILLPQFTTALIQYLIKMYWLDLKINLSLTFHAFRLLCRVSAKPDTGACSRIQGGDSVPADLSDPTSRCSQSSVSLLPHRIRVGLRFGLSDFILPHPKFIC